MQVPASYTGKALALCTNVEIGATFIDVVDVKSKGPYGVLTLTYKGNQLTDSLDYDDRLDAYSHQSDDGERDYTTLHVVCLGDGDPASVSLSDADEMNRLFLEKTPALVQKMLEGRLENQDFSWTSRVLTSPVLLHALIQKNGGNIDKAQKSFITNVLGLS